MHKMSIAFFLLTLFSSPAQAGQIYFSCSGWQDSGEEQLVIDIKSNLVVRFSGADTFSYDIKLANDRRIIASTKRAHLRDEWSYTDNKQPSADELKQLWVEVDINRITGRAVYSLYGPIPAHLRRKGLKGYAVVVGTMVWSCKKAEKGS